MNAPSDDKRRRRKAATAAILGAYTVVFVIAYVSFSLLGAALDWPWWARSLLTGLGAGVTGLLPILLLRRRTR